MTFFHFSVLVAKQTNLDATLSDLSSALHLAIHSGSVPIVETLLEKGLNPNVNGPKAQTPLHLAAKCNRSDLVGVLLKAGAQVKVKLVVVSFVDIYSKVVETVPCLLFR